MKLASLKNGRRDGRLVVVSRDLTRCTDASFLIPTLQAALDDWDRISPHLATLAESLEGDAVPWERFHEHDALSPLPRAYGWIAEGTGDPAPRWMRSDAFAPPRDPMIASGELEAETSLVALGIDAPAGVTPENARGVIRLMALLCMAGSGPFGSATLSPVAVTPDEIEDSEGGDGLAKLSLVVNGRAAGRDDMMKPAEVVAIAARTRALTAGIILGLGRLSTGKTTVRPGETVRVECRDSGGHSVFGAIERTLQPAA